VTEPGQRSLDSVRRILRLTADIGIRQVHLVGNRVTGAADEQRIQAAFPEMPVLTFLPYAEDLLRSDRDGMSVLDGLSPELRNRFERILRNLSP
jgi:CO dehydrogenase maturation factor